MKLSAPIFRLKRRAKSLAHASEVPLHVALDRVAREEGFRSWSHLSASMLDQRPARAMLARLGPGDLVLLGARPGQGKTLMGLELAVEAARAGTPAFFFTLEDPEAVVFERLQRLGADRAALDNKLTVDTSDDICAEHIIDRIGRRAGAVAIIDYLQLLDQRRRNPELAAQVQALRAFAGATGSIIVALSQIDRAFDAMGGKPSGAGRRPRAQSVRYPPLHQGVLPARWGSPSRGVGLKRRIGGRSRPTPRSAPAATSPAGCRIRA